MGIMKQRIQYWIGRISRKFRLYYQGKNDGFWLWGLIQYKNDWEYCNPDWRERTPHKTFN